MRARVGFVIVMAALVSGAVSRAQDYFPLAEGWGWSYETGNGASSLEVTIAGTTAVIGGTAVVRHNVVTGVNAQTFDNFWTRDDQGRFLLHGAHNIGWFWVFYDPPLVFLDAPPLTVGDEWCTEFRLYDYLGDPQPGGPYVYCLTLSTAATLVVPAGEFPAIGIEISPGPRAEFDVFGARLAGDLRTPSSWLADGIGEVRLTMGQQEYHLLSYRSPTPTTPTTWGRVKALFE